MRFTIRDLIWLTTLIALAVWSQMRHAKQAAQIEAELGKQRILEGDMLMWEGRAEAVAETMRNLGIPVTFFKEDRGMSTGPIPPALNPLVVTPPPTSGEP